MCANWFGINIKCKSWRRCKNLYQDGYIDVHVQEKPYNIPTGNQKRVTNRSQRLTNVIDGNLLGYANPVGFALTVVNVRSMFI